MDKNLSSERIKRMQLAKRRKKLGYTRHLPVAGKLAEEKIKKLFDEWNLDLEDSIFIVEGMDFDFELLLRTLAVQFQNVAKQTIEYLNQKKVSEVAIICANSKVLAETERTGNVAFIRKMGPEYLVESYAEWNKRLRVEASNKNQ